MMSKPSLKHERTGTLTSDEAAKVDAANAADNDFRKLQQLVFTHIDSGSTPRMEMKLCLEALTGSDSFLWIPGAEARVLCVGNYVELAYGRPMFDTTDVLVQTAEHGNVEMPLNTARRATEGLLEKGLIEHKGLGINVNNRASRQFALTENGRKALRLALLLSSHLQDSRLSARAA